VRRLLPDERVIRVAHEHWSVFVPVVAGGAAAVAAVAWLLGVVPGEVSGHPLGGIKQLVLLAVVAAALLTFTVRWLSWRYTTFVLTDHRVLVGHGILSRHTESIALDRVQDTAVRQSLPGRLLAYGDVEIESAARDGREVLARMYDPQGFATDLLGAVEAHRTGRLPVPGGSPPPGATAPGPVPRGYLPPEVSGYGPPTGYGPPPRRDGL
jgi:membrane protein YdbS with pleckstrin-like domain